MTTQSLPTLRDIQDAASLLDGNVVHTPFLHAPRLDKLCGARITVKYENMQVTNSFKARGAYCFLKRLKDRQPDARVIAMSAGNHAQAVAYHASNLNMDATIVMPVTTPFIKSETTRGLGAHVVMEGETLAESQIAAKRIMEAEDRILVHPYDDFDVIRGQGSIGLEMLQSMPDLDTLVVPIGGGGLIAGVAIAAKALKPSLQVIGVEIESYASATAALKGETAVCSGNTLAEGIAVKNVGAMTLEAIRSHVDDIIVVNESAIEEAIYHFIAYQRVMAEGAGAAGLAAILSEPAQFQGRNIGLVLCGGNIDPRLLSSIMVRQLARLGQIVALRVSIQDRPGVLGRVTSTIGHHGGNILGVSHHRHFLNLPAKGASIDITFEVRDGKHRDTIEAALSSAGLHYEEIDVGAAELN